MARSLLEPTGNEAAERAAIADSERPGTWFGEPRADGRVLTQDDTNALVRTELFALAPEAEHEELRGILGAPLYPRLADLGRRATRQRGGIDADPLVRLLAFRAWGNRDRRWFEDRGVRKGERVARIRGQLEVALARHDDLPTWIATADARPGERVLCELDEAFANEGAPRFRVSDRLRGDPDAHPDAHPEATAALDAIRELCGFDELRIERDELNRSFVVTAVAHQRHSEVSILDAELRFNPERRVWLELAELRRELGAIPGRVPRNGLHLLRELVRYRFTL